uniref:Uncharacterized protein n=1 Tax=Mycena chlorophos TaxID=658473 RepID=A0ABQ0M7F5_MYCCL|nr:predicted protein [Mycena chlorophos]
MPELERRSSTFSLFSDYSALSSVRSTTPQPRGRSRLASTPSLPAIPQGATVGNVSHNVPPVPALPTRRELPRQRIPSQPWLYEDETGCSSFSPPSPPPAAIAHRVPSVLPATPQRRHVSDSSIVGTPRRNASPSKRRKEPTIFIPSPKKKPQPLPMPAPNNDVMSSMMEDFLTRHTMGLRPYAGICDYPGLRGPGIVERHPTRFIPEVSAPWSNGELYLHARSGASLIYHGSRPVTTDAHPVAGRPDVVLSRRISLVIEWPSYPNPIRYDIELEPEPRRPITRAAFAVQIARAMRQFVATMENKVTLPSARAELLSFQSPPRRVPYNAVDMQDIHARALRYEHLRLVEADGGEYTTSNGEYTFDVLYRPLENKPDSGERTE